LKVCVTHYAYYPTTGGVESHLIDLCTELVRQGHEVHALVGSLKGSPAEQTIDGVQIHRDPMLDIEYARERKLVAGYDPDRPWPDLQRSTREFFEDFIDTHEIDVVHAHNFHHFLPEYGLALTELHDQGLATVLTLHEMWGEFICEHLLEETRWDSIIPVGEHVRQDLVRMAPNVGHVRKILHGINIQMFNPGVRERGLRDELGLTDRTVILHPARMLPWKGVHLSVEAMRTVVEEFPNAVLIVTDTDQIIDWIRELGEYKQQILQSIKEFGLSRNVLPHSFDFFDLPRAYALADIVIYPTCGEEPFGLVPLEAMACAKPVVVSRSGGLVESVVHAKTGYIIDKDNSDQLADRLIQLLGDQGLRESMGRAGRRHVEAHFSRERMVSEVVEEYERGLTKARARARKAEVAARS
jgi:glycosyltransferase involved in cell wall biosynthesis